MSQGSASASALAQLCSILAQEHAAPFPDTQRLSVNAASPSTQVIASSARSPSVIQSETFASTNRPQTAVTPAALHHVGNSIMSGSTNTQAGPPVTSSSSQASQRCSQCKQARPLSTFPKRLTTLKPFQVCKLHAWYWTEEKKELHWAPEHVVTLETVCAEVDDIRSGQLQAGSWLLQADIGEKQEVAKRVCDAGKWDASAM